VECRIELTASALQKCGALPYGGPVTVTLRLLWPTSIPLLNTALGRHESSKKNCHPRGVRHDAKLWLSSARSLRLRRAISIATVNVGTIIAMPSQRHPQHQQESLKIQRTIWAFSYSRAVLNGFNLYVFLLNKLEPMEAFESSPCALQEHRYHHLSYIGMEPPERIERSSSCLRIRCSTSRASAALQDGQGGKFCNSGLLVPGQALF
jgi:hypothetical protein